MNLSIILTFLFTLSFFQVSGQSDILLNERFENNSQKWEVGNDPTENSEIKSGKYLMEAKNKTNWHWFAIDVDINSRNNFSIESSLNKVKGYKDNDHHGLIWGAKDGRNSFLFLISTPNQSYSVQSLFDGNWVTLISWTYSSQINSGRSANKLGIAKVDNDLVFLINDEPVSSTPFQEFYGDKVGFYIGPKLTVFADNLLVRASPNYNSNTSSNWKGNGTGVFLSEEGYLATNYHVIAEASEIEIEFIRNEQKERYKVRVVQSDERNDLAILKIDDRSFNSFNPLPYNFESSLVDVGSSVFALGYPMALTALGTEVKFTDGKISSKTGFQGDITTYQMTTPIQPGNSGGPLFDFNGNLIGINSAKIRADVADNVSYAIKSSYLKSLVDVLPTSFSLPSGKTLVNMSLTEKIKVLSDYVVLIRVR